MEALWAHFEDAGWHPIYFSDDQLCSHAEWREVERTAENDIACEIAWWPGSCETGDLEVCPRSRQACFLGWAGTETSGDIDITFFKCRMPISSLRSPSARSGDPYFKIHVCVLSFFYLLFSLIFDPNPSSGWRSRLLMTQPHIQFLSLSQVKV